MIFFCSQKSRRSKVLQHPTLNGIDFLEVCSAEPGCDCGKLLFITFLKDARPLHLSIDEIRITGGVSSRALTTIVSVKQPTANNPRLLIVELVNGGDFSTYNLSLHANAATSDPPDGVDPQLSAVDFSFKADCPTVSDCLPDNCCPPEHKTIPDINYLAKDYEAFRQVLLDRLAVLSPQWTETHASDLGMAMVEALAYTADSLSYQQDAVGTEAYIGTARSRISMRRHAKLVDYQIGEGSNARSWIYLRVAGTGTVLPAGTRLFPRVPGLPPRVEPTSLHARQLTADPTLAFGTMQEAKLYQQQNEIKIYTWGDSGCCLPVGATETTFVNTIDTLQPGSVLLFEEVLGPHTGDPDDADPSKRWVVRLTAVQTVDFANRVLSDPLTGAAITRVRWGPEDALPFPLCISTTIDTQPDAPPLSDISVARGNIVPADHGTWIDLEELQPIPPVPPTPVERVSCTCDSDGPVQAARSRYFPKLLQGPLTFAADFDSSAPASAFLSIPTNQTTRPQLQIRDDQANDWPVVKDLLSTRETQRGCVAEIETDGTTFLRFGDGVNGAVAEVGMSFTARYRIGNGAAGNIGRDTIGHIVTDVPGIEIVRNPLAAACGVDPESIVSIRKRAPFAFRTQLRAVTEDDYAAVAILDPAIAEARGTLRWTGSWYTAFVSIDTVSVAAPSPGLIQDTKKRLNLFRMTGTDLAIEGAIIVGLRITLNVCVDPTHFRSEVRDALMHLFITGDQCSGQSGLLNSQRFTFGETIYASPLIAAAHAVEGVTSVTLAIFGRMDDPSFDGTSTGFLVMRRLEIARCDNDPNRLDHGLFALTMDGGK